MKTLFDKQLFVWLFISFIVMTVIGTLSHECGHYFVAKLLGHEANLHFASTSWRPLESNEEINFRHNFWISLSGPLQTLLTGTFGLFLLFIFRNTFRHTKQLTLGQWGIIFLSLFWTRQVANFAIWTGNLILGNKYKPYNDEIKIARHLKIPDGIILTTSAFIGLVVIVVIILKFIPKQQRFSFISAGFFGGMFGYMIWIKWLGKYLIP